jgi:hypothetical protein
VLAVGKEQPIIKRIAENGTLKYGDSSEAEED